MTECVSIPAGSISHPFYSSLPFKAPSLIINKVSLSTSGNNSTEWRVMRVILWDETEGGRETTTLSCGEAVLYTEGYLFHPQVQAHLFSFWRGGVMKWQETHWNLILCKPVCVVQDSSSSAPCFHSVLHERRYSLLHQLWTAYRSRAFVPCDPGSDMTFYAHCWFVLVPCYLCLSLLFKRVHNDLAWFLDERILNVLRTKLTHILHSLIHSITHPLCAFCGC